MSFWNTPQLVNCELRNPSFAWLPQTGEIPVLSGSTAQEFNSYLDALGIKKSTKVVSELWDYRWFIFFLHAFLHFATYSRENICRLHIKTFIFETK